MIDRSNSLGQLDVLAPRSFGTLPFFESHCLSFAQLVEGGLATGLMEELLAAVARCNEPETLVVNQTLDCAVRRSHVVCLLVKCALTLSALPMIPGSRVVRRYNVHP